MEVLVVLNPKFLYHVCPVVQSGSHLAPTHNAQFSSCESWMSARFVAHPLGAIFN